MQNSPQEVLSLGGGCCQTGGMLACLYFEDNSAGDTGVSGTDR